MAQKNLQCLIEILGSRRQPAYRIKQIKSWAKDTHRLGKPRKLASNSPPMSTSEVMRLIMAATSLASSIVSARRSTPLLDRKATGAAAKLPDDGEHSPVSFLQAARLRLV
jgi:hypothetical protein